MKQKTFKLFALLLFVVMGISGASAQDNHLLWDYTEILISFSTIPVVKQKITNFAV